MVAVSDRHSKDYSLARLYCCAFIFLADRSKSFVSRSALPASKLQQMQLLQRLRVELSVSDTMR